MLSTGHERFLFTPTTQRYQMAGRPGAKNESEETSSAVFCLPILLMDSLTASAPDTSVAPKLSLGALEASALKVGGGHQIADCRQTYYRGRQLESFLPLAEYDTLRFAVRDERMASVPTAIAFAESLCQVKLCRKSKNHGQSK